MRVWGGEMALCNVKFVSTELTRRESKSYTNDINGLTLVVVIVAGGIVVTMRIRSST